MRALKCQTLGCKVPQKEQELYGARTLYAASDGLACYIQCFVFSLATINCQFSPGRSYTSLSMVHYFTQAKFTTSLNTVYVVKHEESLSACFWFQYHLDVEQWVLLSVL